MIVHAPGSGYVVLFGSGKYLERDDLDRNHYAEQSFYAVRDQGHEAGLTREHLIERRLQKETGTDAFAVIADAGARVPFMGDQHGWYLDFPESGSSGERVVSPALLVDGNVIFQTTLPSAASCQPPRARLHALDTRRGMAAGGSVSGFMMSGTRAAASVLRQAQADATDVDTLGRRLLRPAVEVLGDATSQPYQLQLNATRLYAGRLSWRELLNWQEWQ